MALTILNGKTEYFPMVQKIVFEGVDSKTPFAFRYYDENRKIAGKTMKDHFRFAIAYWHSFCTDGTDPFGMATRIMPWADSNPMKEAKNRADAAFEFITKIGVPYFCWHDRDIAPEGNSIEEYEANLKEIIAIFKDKQAISGVKTLWGTANITANLRYMNGAATNPDFLAVTHAGARVKAALDATIELGGEAYLFFGGREGYTYLFNTDMKRELAHLGMFFRMVRDYGRNHGFKGTFLIEPKPMEPTKHQYDHDTATVYNFIKEYGLENDFKINVENNHGLLAGHEFAHELQTAVNGGMLGGIDVSQGDYQNGWDVDEFPTNIYDAVHAMMVLLESGGIAPGGFNFDAKLRRNSTDIADLFIGHISGMDTFARGLIIADDILSNTDYKKILDDRYASFSGGEGKAFADGRLDLEYLREYAIKNGEVRRTSGKQEYIKNLINQRIFEAK